MPPDRFLADASPGESPSHENVQQLVEAESGKGTQGIYRRWQASDSANVVLISDASGVQISRDNGTTAPTNVINVGTPAGGDLAGTYPNPGLSTATQDLLAPPGAIIAYAGAATPVGWAPCNGTTIPRASYPRLFAAIGTTYNTGGELGTDFRLPNLIGRVVLGVGPTHPLGQSGGAEAAGAHTHPGSHTHGPGVHTHGLNSHTHDLNGHAHTLSAHTHGIGVHTHGLNSHTHGAGSHTHDLNHNHALAAGVAVASGAITGVHEGPSAVVNVSANGHAHDVDLPALGTVASGTPSANDTGGPTTTTVTAAPSANGTDVAAPTNTGTTTGPTGVPSPTTDTGTPTANATAADSSAPAATYPDTTANLPPFLTLGYIIRTGAP